MDLSENQAFAAMYAFLRHRYVMTGSDDIGALLGDMSFMPDGSTADPAIWGDWMEAIQSARSGHVDIYMRLTGP